MSFAVKNVMKKYGILQGSSVAITNISNQRKLVSLNMQGHFRHGEHSCVIRVDYTYQNAVFDPQKISARFNRWGQWSLLWKKGKHFGTEVTPHEETYYYLEDKDVAEIVAPLKAYLQRGRQPGLQRRKRDAQRKYIEHTIPNNEATLIGFIQRHSRRDT